MTRQLGVIGHPVAHSLSPVFQGAALRHCGLDIRYEAWDTPHADLRMRVDALRESGVIGANVTIPHKESVVPLLDELEPQARAIGAVNTITNRDGRLEGSNTDGPGLVRALDQEAGFAVSGSSMLVLGAGGAARGIVHALAAAGARDMSIANRSPARAEALAAEVATAGHDTTVEAVAYPASPSGFDCIINTTSVGMLGTGTEGQSPCDVRLASPGALAVDIVYAPEVTRFLADATAAGLRTLPGLPMLIYQGALAFERWTGHEAPVGVMFEAARSELARRAGEHATPSS